MQYEIDRPEADWLSPDAAYRWLSDRFPVSGAVWEDLLQGGHVYGVRRIRQTVSIHWRGVVMTLWRLELGDLPAEVLGQPPPTSPDRGATSPDRHRTRGNRGNPGESEGD